MKSGWVEGRCKSCKKVVKEKDFKAKLLKMDPLHDETY
jgi:hypothetical protein